VIVSTSNNELALFCYCSEHVLNGFYTRLSVFSLGSARSLDWCSIECYVWLKLACWMSFCVSDTMKIAWIFDLLYDLTLNAAIV